jgi:hypothetical protein
MIKPKTLGIYQFIRNATKYDYPFIESLESAVSVADKILICECFSEDDTLDKARAFQAKYPEKVEIIQHEWVKDFNGLSAIGNYCIPFLDTEWTWQLQSDEVIHEDSYEEIRKCVEDPPRGISAYRVHYHHFLASYQAEFNFCYSDIIRIAKKGTGWWLSGDACQLDRPDKSGVKDTGIQIYHYGKVHEGKIGFQKEVDFQNLFKELGFPDPKMAEMKEKFGEGFCDYVYLFENNIKNKQVWKFEGQHPAIMNDRIARFKDGGWEQFESKMKEGLKLL